jgi:hypothetical protein
MQDPDRTASLMTPAKLAAVKPRAAVSPAAWLDQMASDAGHAHLRRLSDLHADLQSHAKGQDLSSLHGPLAQLGQALPLLDFGLLQPQGWWARARGKNRGSGSELAGQFERIDEALGALAAETVLLRKKQQQATLGDRALLELEVESRALDKVIDQGTRWLQDMRSQLKTRQAADTDGSARQQIEQDAGRCEVLVARLKSLRAVTSAAQQVCTQAKATAARRAVLMQLLQHAFDVDVKDWRARISGAIAGAAEGNSPVAGVESSMESHRDLQLCIKQAAADAALLRTEEQTLAEQLGALASHLNVAS